MQIREIKSWSEKTQYVLWGRFADETWSQVLSQQDSWSCCSRWSRGGWQTHCHAGLAAQSVGQGGVGGGAGGHSILVTGWLFFLGRNILGLFSCCCSPISCTNKFNTAGAALWPCSQPVWISLHPVLNCLTPPNLTPTVTKLHQLLTSTLPVRDGSCSVPRNSLGLWKLWGQELGRDHHCNATLQMIAF